MEKRNNFLEYRVCLLYTTHFSAARVTLVNLSFKMAALIIVMNAWTHALRLLHIQCRMCGKHTHFIKYIILKTILTSQYTILKYALINPPGLTIH